MFCSYLHPSIIRLSYTLTTLGLSAGLFIALLISCISRIKKEKLSTKSLLLSTMILFTSASYPAVKTHVLFFSPQDH